MTDKGQVLDLQPAKEVYIPLVAGANTNFEILVEEGQTVAIGTKLAETKTGFYVPVYSSGAPMPGRDIRGASSC